MKDCRRPAIEVVVVWKFDRCARSLKTLISGLELCRAFGIDFVSVTEAVDTSLPAGEMLFQMTGAVAQFERSLISERVKSGLDHARKSGQILGRPALHSLSPKEIKELSLQRGQKMPFRTLAKNLAFLYGQRTSYAEIVGMPRYLLDELVKMQSAGARPLAIRSRVPEAELGVPGQWHPFRVIDNLGGECAAPERCQKAPGFQLARWMYNIGVFGF